MRIVPFIALLIPFTACTFEPEDDYFVEVEIPNPVPTNFNFFNSKDTLAFRKSVDLNLTSSNGSDIISYKLMLGTTVLSESDESGPYLIPINSRLYPDGTYDLTLILKKRTNGESLASRLGVEYYEEKITKTAVIFNAPLPKPKIFIKMEDGILTFNWEKYEGLEFNKYYVHDGISVPYEEITDQNVVKYEVPAYTGGHLFFSLTLMAYNEWVQVDTSYYYSLNQIIEKTQTGVKLTWNTSPFKNWNGIRVHFEKDDGSYEYFTADKTQNELFIDHEWVFPYQNRIEMAARNSIDNNEFTLLHKNITSDLTGYPSNYNDLKRVLVESPFDTAFTVYCQGASIGSDILIRYGAIGFSDKELFRQTGIFSISPKGDHVFEFKNNVISKIDPITFDKLEELSVSSIVGSYDEFLQLHVSDQPVVLIYVRKGVEKWYYTIDWQTKNMILIGNTRDSFPLTKNGYLTPNGEKFVQPSQYLHLQENPNRRSLKPGVTMVDKERNIHFNDNTLTLSNLGLILEPITTTSYSKVVKAAFTNNENIVGFAYAENGKTNIDFFNSETLDIVYTLKTSLDGNLTYRYFMHKNKLFVTDPAPVFNPKIIELDF